MESAADLGYRGAIRVMTKGAGEMSEREKMRSGEAFDGRDPEIIALRDRGQTLLRELNHYKAGDSRHQEICAELFEQFGPNSILSTPFCCEFGSNIRIGTHSYINFNVTMLDVGPIVIGDNVMIAPNVQLYTATHDEEAQLRRSWAVYGKAITIGDDVWIGGGAIICPGVTIGPRSIIGAGAVVTRDIPADSVALGNPARVVRQVGGSS